MSSLNNKKWSKEKAWEWYRGHEWLCGFNYIPSNTSNSTELWQKDGLFDSKLIERELSLAESLGLNTCRIFLQYLVWKQDRDGILKKFDEFLKIASKRKISVMPVLFDDCAFGEPAITDPFLGKQRDPIPGTVLSSWTPNPGHTAVVDQSVWPDLENYIKEFISLYKNDSRIILWDLYNEPGNSGMNNRSLPLLKATFRWAREVEPTQPLTVAIWSIKEAILEYNELFPKSKLEELVELNQFLLEESDIISFHRYADLKGMKNNIDKFKAYGLPVICSEWMARPLGSCFELELPLFKKEKVGCYHFGLVNGKTQCQFPWWNKMGDPEPERWFHDIYYNNGIPYDESEIESIRNNLSNKNIFSK